MGPPIYIGGNSPHGLPPPKPRPGFNGATDLHRWKPAPAPQRRNRTSGGFNGATDLHRWKLRARSHNSDCSARFNGATDLHRWKQTGGRNPQTGKRRASMGPPIYIGGNATWGGSPRAINSASMGPPIYIGGNRTVGSKALNWAYASMGPPIYIGGNPYPIWRGCPVWWCFNGATDLHRWKQEEDAPVYIGYVGFNGATDLHRWKH